MHGNDTSALVVDAARHPTSPRVATRPPVPFVARLDASGSRLLYRTTMTTPVLSLSDLALGIDGRLLMAGRTSGGLATVNAWQPELAGRTDAYIGTLEPDGRISTLSYFGGAADDGELVKVRATSTGFALAFETRSSDLPVVRPWVAGHVDGPVYTSNDRGASWSRPRYGRPQLGR